MLRRFVVAVSLVGLIVSSLGVLPAAAEDEALAVEEPGFWPEPYDYPLVPSEALPPGMVIPDPVEEAPTALLEDGVADLPSDAAGEAEVDGSWSAVPGTPVSVATAETVPAEPAPADTSATPGAGAAGAVADPVEANVPEGAEVEVSVVRPDDLGQGVALLSVQVDSSAVVAPETADPSSEPTTEPTSEPAPSVATQTPDPSGTPDTAATAPATETTDPSPTAGTAEAAVPSESSAPSAAPQVAAPVAAEGVGVRVSYGAFDEMYGAGWADRLVVRAYPACFATTPAVAGCAEGVVVESVNNMAANELEFVTPSADDVLENAAVAMEAEAETSQQTGAPPSLDLAESAVVFAVASEPKQFEATPYSVSSEWQVGPGSGEFTYQYPFDLPAATGGQAPDLGLFYSSGGVDTVGKSQVSETGIGWGELSPGYITRDFASCEDDQSAGETAFDDRGDKCWRTFDDGRLVEELHLVLDGRSSRLVHVSTAAHPSGGVTEEFRLTDDPGWKVTRRSDYVAGSFPPLVDNNHERWIVRTPDGTEYWLGGLSDTGGGSNATWTVPVFGNDAGEPCHINGALASSWCPQAWRWNLDRVIDPVGNEIRYSYTAAVNRYDRFGGGDSAQYHRSGALASVEYGFRTDPNNPNQVAGPARQVVEVQTVPRCWEATERPTSADCTAAVNPIGQWPDTPTDLVCTDTSCGSTAPAFFSTRRLYQVKTFTQQGQAGSLVKRPVATYTLEHVMPDPTVAPTEDMPQTEPPNNLTVYADLWFNFIRKTGHIADEPDEADRGVSQDLARVAFDGRIFNTRVAPSDGVGRLPKWRLFAVRNELGGRIDVDYGHKTGNICLEDYVDGADNQIDTADDRDRWTSQKECFALADPEDKPNGDPKFDWYHKYVVTRVAISDDAVHYRYDSPFDQFGPATPVLQTGPNPGQVQVTEYDYDGDPGWRFAQSQNVPTKREAWSDWRGYGQSKAHVLVVKNQVPVKDRPNPPNVVDELVSRTIRFRGLHGSKASPTPGDNVTASVTTADSGGPVPDERWLNGMTAETALLRPNDDLVQRSYTAYDFLRTVNDLDEEPYNARLVYAKRSLRTTQLLDATGANTGLRQHEVVYTVDDGGASHRGVRAGAVTESFDRGDITEPDDDKCTLSDYKVQDNQDPDQAGIWIRRPGVMSLHSGNCTGAGASNQQSRIENFFDHQLDNSVSEGLLTRTEIDTGPDAGPGGADQRITTEYDYDLYGRPTSRIDPRGNVTVTEYNAVPAGTSAGDVLTHLRVTQVQDGPDLVTATKLDPQGGLPVEIKDPNDDITRLTYDGLGRTQKVFVPRNTNPLTGLASIEYTYYTSLRDSISDPTSLDKPSRITTKTLRTGSTVDTSHVFYDGWGRTIESDSMRPQDPYTQTQRVVTATTYDHRGLSWRQTAAFASANPTPSNPEIVNPNLDAAFGTVTVPRHNVTDYDPASRPTSVADLTGSQTYRTTFMSYQGNGSILNQPGPGRTITTKDVWDRPVAVSLASDADPTTAIDAASYTYTTRGELDTISKTLPDAPDPYVWDYDYDWAGRRIQAVDPDTGVTTSTYDEASNLITTATYAGLNGSGDPTGLDAKITTTYDQLNRPTTKTDETEGTPGLTLAQWNYDQRLDAQGNPITGLNLIGRQESVTTTTHANLTTPGLSAPNLLPWTTTSRVNGYDANGNPTGQTTTYPKWLTTTETATIDGPDAGTAPNDTEYDFVAHSKTLTYNQLDQPVTTTDSAAPGQAALALTYTYLTDGLLKSIVQGTTISLAAATYTAIGETATLTTTTPVSSPTHGLVRAYTYEAATGRPSTIVGTSSGSGGASPVQRLGLLYEYDTANNPTRITNAIQTTTGTPLISGSWCYAYDPLDRLTRAYNGKTNAGSGTGCTTPTTPSDINNVRAITGELHDLGYTYSGDRLATVQTPGTGTATGTRTFAWADSAPHQTTAITASGSGSGLPPDGTLDYDPVGRATSAPGSRAYTYDHQGQLVRTTKNVTTNNTFAYNADGTRFARRGPSKTTVWFGNTEITRHTNRTTSSHHITTPGGTPLATRTGEALDPGAPASGEAGWAWQMTDAQDTVRLTRTPAGAYQPHHYYPYGEPNAISTPQLPSNEHGYLNKTHDPDTGDIRLDHRAYTPNLNLLTTPDPLLEPGDPQTLNPYSYSRNNPIRNMDPTGLTCVSGDPEISCNPGHPSAPVPEPNWQTPLEWILAAAAATEESSGFNPIRARQEIGAGMIGGTLETADELVNQILEKSAVDLRVDVGGEWRGLVEQTGVADTNGFLYFLGEIIGIPVPGLAGVSAATAATRVSRFVTRVAARLKGSSSLDEFWELSNVGKVRAGTTVPESFDIATAGQKFSVHPNATKHMAEYALSKGVAPPISSFAGSIETAVSRGLTPGRNFVQVGPWELGIDTQSNVIYHAVYRP